MRRLGEKTRYCGDHLGSDRSGMSVAGPCAHIPISPPCAPIAQQKPLFISGTDQILKGHLIVRPRRRRSLSQEALEHTVAEFVREFKSLNETITELVVCRLA